MGPSSPYFELICDDDMVYESWIGPRSTLVHKDVLVITQGCIRDSEQSLQIGVINKLDSFVRLINQLVLDWGLD